MWMLKGGIGERPLDHYTTSTAPILHAARSGITTETPEEVRVDESNEVLNENETYRELITGALEDIMTNYDKRIRPGYGGIYKIKKVSKMAKLR